VFWLMPLSVSAVILCWAYWPVRAPAHGRLGYDFISGPIRLAAATAAILLVWTVSLGIYFIASHT
jgi:hypothetical protein